MDCSTGHTHALVSSGNGCAPGAAAWEPQSQANASHCMRCPVRDRCIGGVAAHAGTRQLMAVLSGRRELQRGQAVHQAGETFETLFVVRSGALKSLAAGDNGQRVRGFHFPGELVGVDALAAGRHLETAVALEATELCAVRFHPAGAATPAGRAYDGRLWDMMSRDLLRRIVEAETLAGLAPPQRLLAWIVSSLARLRNPSSGEVHLPVRAEDAGSYLGLGPEATAEALAGLAAHGLLALDGDGIRILQPELLRRPGDR
jgi:CRP/FNR family transcriptional regulator